MPADLTSATDAGRPTMPASVASSCASPGGFSTRRFMSGESIWGASMMFIRIICLSPLVKASNPVLGKVAWSRKNSVASAPGRLIRRRMRSASSCIRYMGAPTRTTRTWRTPVENMPRAFSCRKTVSACTNRPALLRRRRIESLSTSCAAMRCCRMSRGTFGTSRTRSPRLAPDVDMIHLPSSKTRPKSNTCGSRKGGESSGVARGMLPLY